MTETSCITPTQELFNRLRTQHPGKQILILLSRIEKLEALHEGTPKFVNLKGNDSAEINDPMAIKMTRSEKMKASWAKRKAKLV